MKHGVTILVLLGAAVAAMGAHDLSQDYRFSVKLAGEDYILHWTADFENNNLAAAVNVSTTGWVGFGLSPNGQMPGSDVIIAWVNNEGEVQFQDRHAVGRFLPPVDSSQDWILVSGEEQDGRTIIEFTRPLLSCDSENDLDVTVDTSRVVWSYHSQDPANEEELATLQHERIGASSLNFLGGLNEERVEEDTLSFSLLSNNVLIPENDTTYWCTVHALPDEVAAQEKYIYKFAPVIAESTSSFVHHMVIFLCPPLSYESVGDGDVCGGTHLDIKLCRGRGIVFASWAVGGVDFVFPNGVGYPMGGNGYQFLILEMHYDNPNMVTGMVDNSGMKFFYTNEAPENRAGYLIVGHSPTTLVIPPGADNFVVNSITPQQCTEKLLPEEGITIFGSFLHTHLIGQSVVVRHLRNTEECDGLEELEPVDQNLRYDFDYQQTNILPKTVQFLPGDILHLQCSYGTSAHQTVTVGGESTREEMCLAMLYYYPESEFYVSLGKQVAGQQFSDQYLQPGDHDTLQASYRTFDRQSVSRILNQVEWNQQSIESFQSAVDSSTISSFCLHISNYTASIASVDALPQAVCPYEPPSKDCFFSGAGKVLSVSVYHIFILCAVALDTY